MSDHGVVSIDPLPQDAGPGTASATATATAALAPTPARNVLVDTPVRWSFKTKRLFVDESGIWWGDDSAQFGAITSYSHWIVHKLAGGASAYEYHIRLWSEGKKPFTILYIGKEEGLRTAYDATTRALWEFSGRRRLEDVIDRVGAGQEVVLGEWTVSRAGAQRGRKSLTWNEEIELRPSNVFPGVEVRVTREGKSKHVSDVSSESQDGPLCRQVFAVLMAGAQG